MDAALCRVSARGDVRAATRLLALGASPDAKPRVTEWCHAPLCALGQAAWHGHVDVVNALLAAGAQVDVHGCRSALVAAAAHGHVTVVDRLLAAGANVNADYGDALKEAARNGHVAVVDRLLRAGAEVGGRGRFEYSALHKACEQAHLAVVQRFDVASPLSQAELDHALESACGHSFGYMFRSQQPTEAARLGLVAWLLERGANSYTRSFATLRNAASAPSVLQRLLEGYRARATALLNDDALLWACAAGEVTSVAGLVERPLDPWVRVRALIVAASTGQTAVLEVLLIAPKGEHDDQADVLDEATRHGHATLVDWLLLRNPDDERRDRALRTAIMGNRAALVERLLCGRASAPLPREALWQAAKRGNLAFVDLLLATGLVNATADAVGLWTACAEGHVDVARRLLDFGMNVNVRNSNTQTNHHNSTFFGHQGSLPSGEAAIVAASADGHLEVVNLLLARGARVSAHAPFRQTPLMAACDFGHVDIVERLLAAGADVHAPDDAVRHVIAAVDETHVHPYDLLEVPPAVGAATVFAQGPGAVRDAPIRLASEGGHAAIVVLLLRRGADARKISWDDLALDTWPGVVAAVPRSLLKSLPDDVQPVWVCAPPSVRTAPASAHSARLQSAGPAAARGARGGDPDAGGADCAPADRGPPLRARVLDRRSAPVLPRIKIRAGAAGRRFAREYWTEGLPLFFPGLRSELGPVPDEFCVRV